MEKNQISRKKNGESRNQNNQSHHELRLKIMKK